MDHFQVRDSFAEASENASSIHELVKAFGACVEPLGVTAYTCVIVRDEKDNSIIGRSFGERSAYWHRRYREAGHRSNDLVANRALQFGKSGYWADLVSPDERLTKRQQAVYSDAAAVGITQGFVTPVALFDRSTTLVGVYGEKLDDSPISTRTYKILASHFAAEGHRLMRAAPPANDRAVTLTLKQTMVLRYKLADLKDFEVAAAMNVSVKTVEHHLKAVRELFGVRTTWQAIREAEQLGVIP